MRKFFITLVFLSLSVVSWASHDADGECYYAVVDQLKKNHKFGHVLVDAWRANLIVNIQCKKKEQNPRAPGPNVKEGDRVVTGWIDADVKVKVQPMDLRGGSLEKVSVRGSYGFRWKIKDSNFFDVEKLTYEKEILPEPAREEDE